MAFRKFARSLAPARFLPGDSIGFDGAVEDIATFTFSEPFDGALVHDSGVLSDEYSLEILTNPLQVLQNIKPYGGIVLVASIPAGASGNIFTAGDETISVANAAGQSTVTVGLQTSPAIPEGTWHILVLQGTTWTVRQLSTTVDTRLKLQNLLVFGTALSAQQLADLLDVAESSHIIRSVDEAGVTITDLGTSQISTDWHIVSV